MKSKSTNSTGSGANIDSSLDEWLDREVPAMIDEEMKRLQETKEPVAVDEKALEAAKGYIINVIRELFE